MELALTVVRSNRYLRKKFLAVHDSTHFYLIKRIFNSNCYIFSGSTKSLINRLSRQQDEIETLKATVRQLQLASSGNV